MAILIGNPPEDLVVLSIRLPDELQSLLPLIQTAKELRQALEAASTKAASPLNRRTLAAIAGLLVVAGLALFFFLRTPPVEGEINSIAVLPLDIKSTDPVAEYISDGITESVNNSLAGLPGLNVVPHSAALRYKGKSSEIQKVGAALGV